MRHLPLLIRQATQEPPATATLALPVAIEKEIDSAAAKASVQRVEIDSANPTTFLIRTDKAEFLQHEVPRKCLEVVLRKYAIEGIRDIALGYNGAYVVLGKGTKISWLVGDWDWMNKQLKGPKAIKVWPQSNSSCEHGSPILSSECMA